MHAYVHAGCNVLIWRVKKEKGEGGGCCVVRQKCYKEAALLQNCNLRGEGRRGGWGDLVAGKNNGVEGVIGPLFVDPGI